MKLSGKEKIAYGLGAVGKDMVYMLSASYILYYYQDLLGLSGIIMGGIMMAARIFDAFNDPIMGIIVAKTRTKWGKFRPWLFIGTLTNAVVLFMVFSAPPSLDAKGLAAYAAIFYILWGVTYTMMDIPYWSMIPAFTEGGREREGMTSMARSCAGVGSALITVITMLVVPLLGGMAHPEESAKVATLTAEILELQELRTAAEEELTVLVGGNGDASSVPAGKEDVYDSLQQQLAELDEEISQLDHEVALLNNPIERSGFSWFALVVAVIFVVFISITCLAIREKSSVDMESPSIGAMFKALVTNDQAMTVVVTIVLVNASLYITSNLLIYFFKYDIGGADWNSSYVLFNTFGGGMQILSMMLIYPLARKFLSVTKVCYASFGMAIGGYAVLLILMMSGVKSIWLLLIPGFFVFVAFGLLTVLTTVFLANTVDYGELKNNRRDESVIFSMQTFVVKLASGVAVFITGIALDAFHITKDSAAEAAAELGAANLTGLRLTMTALPIAGMVVAVIVFLKKFILTESKMMEINKELEERHGVAG